jgi:predicted peroxiredoxin
MTRQVRHFLSRMDLRSGHDVEIFLLAEGTSVMRKFMVNAILPVGWPPLSETLEKVVARHIPISS